VETGGLPRCFYDIRDMAKSYAANGYPYTPAVGLLNGLNQSCQMILTEGLDAVFARHARIADGVRAAVEAWGLELCAARPELYSNSVSAIRTPEGFDATRIVTHAADTYGVAFGVGLGEVAGKVFRIGHLGMLTDVLALSRYRDRGNGDGRSGSRRETRLRRRRRAGGLSQHRHVDGAGRRMRGEEMKDMGWTCRAGTTCWRA
jgi:hypothetical protein